MQHDYRKIFLDCGAHNGCSVKKFTTWFKDYEIFSFEPNPVLFKHHDNLPNTLIKKAVWVSKGTLPFYLDEKDWDGSSMYKEKKNIVGGSCILVPTIDLADFIKENFVKKDLILLKLDIEGAEYPVLQHLIETNIITYIDTLLIEWHYKKINKSKEEHDALVEKIKEFNIPITNWDGYSKKSDNKDIEYLCEQYG